MGLNNNPKANASNTNVYNFGRNFGRTSGSADFDEYLVSVKISGQAAAGLTVSAAAGFGQSETDAANSEVDYTFINGQASYKVAKTTEAYTGIELLQVDKDGSINDEDHILATVGVTTTF